MVSTLLTVLSPAVSRYLVRRPMRGYGPRNGQIAATVLFIVLERSYWFSALNSVAKNALGVKNKFLLGAVGLVRVSLKLVRFL
jgi:hypothetical protein